MRILLFIAVILSGFRLYGIDYSSLGYQTGLQNQVGWKVEAGGTTPPPGVEFRNVNQHGPASPEDPTEGITNLVGYVTMPSVVLAGTYRVWIKCYTYGSNPNAATTNAIYTVNFGGPDYSVRPNGRDVDGHWQYMGSLVVPVNMSSFTLTISAVGGGYLFIKGFQGIFLSQNPNLIVTADDYAQEWVYPTAVDASAPVAGNYIVNGHFENGVHDVSVTDNTTKWYDSIEAWDSTYAHSGTRALRMNVRNCADQNEFAIMRTRPFVIRGNKAHSASVWVKSEPEGAKITINILPVIRVPAGWGFPAQTNYTSSQQVITTTNWTQVKAENQILLNYPAPAQYYLEVRAIDTASSPPPNNIWFDDLWFGEGTTAPAFAPKYDMELQIRNTKLGGLYQEELNEAKVILSVYNSTGGASLQTVNYEIYDSQYSRVANSTLNLNCAANTTSETQLDVQSLQLGHYRIVAWLANGSESEIYFSKVHSPRVIDEELSLFGGHIDKWWWLSQLGESVGWNRIFSPNACLRWDQIEKTAGNFVWFDALVDRVVASRKANLACLWQNHATWAHRTFFKISGVTGPGFQIGETVTQTGGKSGVVTWAGIPTSATGPALQLSNVIGTFEANLSVIGGTSGTIANQEPAYDAQGALIYFKESADLVRYTNYVYQVVNRYKDLIKFWEIGNEPQHDSSLPKTTTFEYSFYHQMVITAHDVITSLCPDCKIVVGSGVNDEGQMNAALSGIPANIRTNAYAATYHIYATDMDASATAGSMTTRAQAILNTATGYGIPRVWNGESGVYTYSGWYGNRANWRSTGTPIMAYRDCEDQLGGYTDRLASGAEQVISTVGARTKVHFYYDNRYYHQYGDTANSYQTAYTDIDLGDTIKPIGTAQRFCRWILEGGGGRGRASTPVEIFSWLLDGNGGTPWVSFFQSPNNPTNKVLNWSLSSADYQVFDCFGKPLPQVSGQVKFGRRPVLVKGIGSTTIATFQSAIAGGSFTTVADTTAPKLVIAEYPKTTATPLQKHRIRIRWLGNDAADDGSGDVLSATSIDGLAFRDKLDSDPFSPWDQVSYRDFVGLSTGSHTLTVECRDRALNTISKSVTFSVP